MSDELAYRVVAPLAGEESLDSLERTRVGRERISQLKAVGRELSCIEEKEKLLEAIPRLAMTLLPLATAQFLEEGPEGFTGGTGEPFALVVPFRDEEVRRVLVVGFEAPLQVSDRELLSVFGLLVGAALSRVRSSTALRQAAARDAATLESTRDGVVTLDEQGLVQSLNQVATRLLRVGSPQLLGRRLQEVSSLAPLAEALGSSGPLSDEVVSLAHGDMLVRALPYEGGRVVTLQELVSARRLAHRSGGSPSRFTFEDLIGEDPAFLSCLDDARRAARSEVPLLITGESGTGKELLAQAIHQASPRAGSPFVGINVSAIPRELLESELFGYERGAFTGARAGGNPGKFELADRGTLLLDEIGDMPLEMQTRLLRVLQERVLQRLGGTRDLPITARVIATTHRDLERAVGEGVFRLDLFHRLRVVHLRLPPLRERRGDIPLLVEHHLRRQASLLGRSLRMAPHVLEVLMAYDWPGNVRELANLLEGVVSLLPERQDVIACVPPVIERALQHGRAQVLEVPGWGPAPEEAVLPLEEVERRVFEHALRHCGGSVTRAAKALGVAKGTFYSKIRRYGLALPDSATPPQGIPIPDKLRS